MKKLFYTLLISISLIGFGTTQTVSAQPTVNCYTVTSGGNKTILIENGKLYRVTIKSCWYSAYARIGTYLIYGLNISDSKTNGEPCVLTVQESSSIDWTFSYTLSGSYNANMKITSGGWGDQGLLIVVEELKCD